VRPSNAPGTAAVAAVPGALLGRTVIRVLDTGHNGGNQCAIFTAMTDGVMAVSCGTVHRAARRRAPS